MTRHTNKSHIARSVIESVAYQADELLKAFELDLGVKLSTLSVDGGMTANNLLMQFQADISNLQIQSQKIQEVTAFGAGLASYVYINDIRLDTISANQSREQTWSPNMNDNIRFDYLNNWNKAIGKAKNWM